MNKKLTLILALSGTLAMTESQAQNRQQGRGFGPPRDGDRGGERGGFGQERGGERGGFPGGGRGQRPSMMSFLPVLKALDADGNGEISSKEIENAAAALKTLDKNDDGKLTEDELRPQGPPGGGRGGPGGPGGEGGFRGRPDGEGFGPPRGGFDREQGDRGDMDRRRGFGGPPREGESGPEGRSGRPDPADMVKRLMAFDKNGDGKLAKDELSSRMQSLIERADTNKDGFADKEELMKLAEGQGGGRGRGGFGDRGDRGGRREGSPEGDRPRRPEFDN